MSGIADSGPAAGGFMLAVLYAIGHIIVAVSKWLKAREQAREMAAVPPTVVRPPGPDVDAAVLARLQRLEEHDVLTTALSRSEARVDDAERQIQELRRELERVTLQRNAERAVAALKDSLIRAKDERIARLAEDLARERTRRRGGAIEVAAEHEHRDASQAGELQDALKTPLRPSAPRPHR